MMEIVKCECQGCKNRHANCHGECESYLAFRNYLNNKNEEYRRKTESNLYFIKRSKTIIKMHEALKIKNKEIKQ